MTMTERAYRSEQARQTEILVKAVDKALHDAADGCDPPMLNAVIGALVVNLANSLSSIGDPRTRKQMRHLVDKELSRQIAGYLAAGTPSSKTVIIDGGMH
ncbi:hypothetical protein [Rhizobium sp. FKY42]|uniref:hypothetical protein n=1 Tax=Rhizobium sp. FKY42 TaxID=2562310 RepID=UPI0010BF8829|nr:hypothetical protein [Rhizobium sp. FKY42]